MSSIAPACCNIASLDIPKYEVATGLVIAQIKLQIGMSVSTNITAKREQIQYLQRFHWVNDRVFEFTNIPLLHLSGERYMLVLSDLDGKNAQESNYGIYDDAVIMTIDEHEYIIDKMLIHSVGIIRGDFFAFSRKEYTKRIKLTGVQKPRR